MKSITRMLAGSAAIFTASAFAQVPEYVERESQEYSREAAAGNRALLTQPELDRVLAPIALYPDSLLSQLLMAATFPRDVAEAARWSRQNPGLQGDEAVRAVERQPWEPSVKSLAAFPEILAMMGEKPDWTALLGEAFMSQEVAVMQTVQVLRRRADEAGNLRSDDRLLVEREGDTYVIDQPSPELVYVPYYDPRVVYGPWWWPDYQPVYWNPWPGYAYYGGFGFGWGRGISLHRDFFYGGFAWGRRHVRYSGHRPYYFRGDNYWRGWRDHRGDGRRYAQDRSARYTTPRYTTPRYSQDRSASSMPRNDRRDGQPRADGQRRYDSSLRTAAPRYNADPARGGRMRSPMERPAQVQQGITMQRSARVPQSASRGASLERGGFAREARAPRSAQPSRQAPQASQRSSGGDRGGGGGQGGNHGGRGRER